MVTRYHAAVVANGTFFSKDAQKRLMGNLVSAGQFLKYSPRENYGTTLGIRAGNQPELVTARVDGTPEWHQHWFSLTAGPRLLRQGSVSIAPRSEGFTDLRVMGVAARSAIGFPQSGNKLVLVTFLARLSLEREARLMRAIGCYEAMNLDGGTSVALSQSGRILVTPKRSLTNAIVVYDAHHPAPRFLQAAWLRFQSGERPSLTPRFN
jgi:exopolysaccharide biosynthesis protein